jgi:hypothetical protein
MDPHPVRPGTSDALFARTIDATVHPPLVRAQETVVAAVPRVTATVTSPLFLSTVALTLILVWVAWRARFKTAVLVLSTLMVMTLTSFHPVTPPQKSRIADVRRPRTTRQAHVVRDTWQPTYVQPAEPVFGPEPVVVEIPTPSPDAEEMIRQGREQVREIMEQMRQQMRDRLREEARRREWQRYYRISELRALQRLVED